MLKLADCSDIQAGACSNWQTAVFGVEKRTKIIIKQWLAAASYLNWQAALVGRLVSAEIGRLQKCFQISFYNTKTNQINDF